MQNGSIGEARAKAFLLNRFWVLERSVDVDGSDFIIQRRITNKNMLDIQPPRLGVVQVKFFGTTTTSQYVHKEYIMNANGEIRTEFFLLCHSGNEDKQLIHILTAGDLKNDFPISTNNGKEKYRISYDSITTSTKYQVSNQQRALDRIEHALEHAGFKANRNFLSWALPSVRADIDSIHPLYKEPIDNWWGDLSDSFKDIKELARQTLYDIQDIYALLSRLSVETDPLVAKDIMDEIAHD